MHYSSGSQRVDETAGLAQIDAMIANTIAKIKRRDEEVQRAWEHNPDSWQVKQQKLSWNAERPVLLDGLAQLQQKKKLLGPDTGYRPAPSTFFVGGEG